MKTNIAALDIGSNSFHLIVASATSSGSIEIIDRKREVIRLAQGSIGNTKTINIKVIEQAVEVIEKFKIIANSHNATMRAIATSAVRESQNKNEFVKTIKERTGVDVEVISGVEEARLIFSGIKNAIPKLNCKSFSVDIGGGSTEFIISGSNEIEYVKSIKLGAVRLTQQFFPYYIITDEKVAEAKKWVKEIISPILKVISGEKIEKFIGTSGTILNVGMMIRAIHGEGIGDYQALNNFEFTANELFEVEEKILSEQTSGNRKNIAGLEESRSDIIPAGIIIITTLFRMFGIEKMVISNYALREGIIFDSMEKLNPFFSSEKLI